MIKQTKILLFGFLLSILSLGCSEEPKVEITRMEISTQADIDFICENLPDGDSFQGTILISTEEVLDYKCLEQIKHVYGDLILNGPGSTLAFRNIETIEGREVLSICDNAVDTIFFTRLKEVNNGLGISISTFCDFDNVIYMPNIESLSGISMGSPSEGVRRSGTFSGFDKVEEVVGLRFDTSNGLEENITIDGFRNLKRVQGEFIFNKFSKEMVITEGSFDRLEEVGLRMRVLNGPDEDQRTDLTLEYLFPSLRSCGDVELLNIDPEQACYLTPHIEAGTLSVATLNTITNESYGDEGLLTLCE